MRPHLFVTLGLSAAAMLAACKQPGASAHAELTSATVDGGTIEAMGMDAPDAASMGSASTATFTTPGAANQGTSCQNDRPCLGAIAREVSIWKEPARHERIGYLRLGARVARDAQSAGNQGCAGGFYRIEPRGYVCIGQDATLDMQHPLLKVASLRPDTSRPLPYTYVFVRAVAPQYLRAPNAAEQLKREFKLAPHLEWFNRKGKEANALIDGANDVALSWRPVAGGAARKSSMYTFGERFGAQSAAHLSGSTAPIHEDDDGFDPLPDWLAGGGRTIPNVSSFKVNPGATMADRVRRHTGLAVIGAFQLGDDSLHRSFAITTDLRLVPISKLKPDAASPWHGVELGTDLQTPLAFARGACDKKKSLPCTQTFRIAEAGGVHADKELAFRETVALSGKLRRLENVLYRELSDGRWVRAADVGAVVAPDQWPGAADRNEKWIEVSIENQTLVLWQGKQPLFATLVSTGQDGLGDPKTTKSTPRGFFRIKSKHVTATMDSNERSSSGSNTSSGEGEAAPAGPKGDKGEKKEGEGNQRRRGEGLFELRDVPYVQYFEAGFALHAAYWHDVFGAARSHGCVNLSPIDALRVFRFSDPPVPDGWHGMVAGEKDGTVVYVHP